MLSGLLRIGTALENIAAHPRGEQSHYKRRISFVFCSRSRTLFRVLATTREGEAKMKRKQARNELIELGRASLETRGGPTGMDDVQAGYFRWPALGHD